MACRLVCACGDQEAITHACWALAYLTGAGRVLVVAPGAGLGQRVVRARAQHLLSVWRAAALGAGTCSVWWA